jgi:outer membrane protein assembly factor BamC
VIDRRPTSCGTRCGSSGRRSGFNLTLDQADIGIMETDWAENRAKLPQDVIRSTLGKVFDGAVFHGRTRQVPHPPGAQADGRHRDLTSPTAAWSRCTPARPRTAPSGSPAPADPELEAEFLRRLMVKLGVPQEQSKAAARRRRAQADRAPDHGQQSSRSSRSTTGFDRAWRRVGLALDRTGFTVEDRDRNAHGLYFVRYVAPSTDKKEPGFIGKLLGADLPRHRPRSSTVWPCAGQGDSHLRVRSSAPPCAPEALCQRRTHPAACIADDLK